MGKDGTDERITAGARAIASALRGPAGQIPLDRIVIPHLAWFDLCQERGMTWPQIARLLQHAGAGRENGRPFTSGHLSSVVWRQRQRSRGGLAAAAPPSPTASLAGAEPSETGQAQPPLSRRTASLPLPPIAPVPAQAPIPPAPPPEPAQSDVRAMMRRAAQLRSHHFDDEE